MVSGVKSGMGKVSTCKFRSGIIFAVLSACAFFAPCFSATSADNIFEKVAKGKIDAKADKLDFVGDNLIASGNVLVKHLDTRIYADKAVINQGSKDIEIIGNVRFIDRKRSETEIEDDQFKKFQENPDVKVRLIEKVIKPTGKVMLRVELVREDLSWTASRAEGNLATGFFKIDDFAGNYTFFYIEGKTAERDSEGIIRVRDAEISTCEYLKEDHEHYSISAASAVLTPVEKDRKIDFYADKGRYSMWAYYCWLRLGGVALIPAPVLYKPADNSGWGIQVVGGHDSDWGYFLLTRKKFKIADYPNTTLALQADYYSERGFATGTEIIARTRDSYTEFFVYGMNDRAPYGPDEDGSEDFDESTRRLENDEFRYDLRLSHLNHLTPRLDFRGHIEKISDIDFLDHYFVQRFEQDPQPATFASLEYQFDRAIASAYIRPRINSFYSVVETLPEFRLDFPRQELHDNIYYQGETSIARLKTRWRDYDKVRTAGNGVDPGDYRSLRLDSLHMLYYPLTFDWLNLIPRAGVRLTYYRKSSDRQIDNDDLLTLFAVDSPDGRPGGSVVNYDDDGGEQWRFTGEVGIEANTKIYRSWQDAKSAYWEIDGLRHVAVPYINYVFIPRPTENRDEIYYFDDIDRIHEQNFIRLGLKQRLQTRREGYKKSEIYEWASLENFIDFHFKRDDGFRHLGELGTKLKFHPIPELTFTMDALFDTGLSNEHDVETRRGRRTTSRKGLRWQGLNELSATLDYQIREDIHTWLSYSYQDAYRQRSIYSMGSSLAEINSGTSFSRTFNRNQTVTAGIEFPIPIDDKTNAELEATYDFEAGYIRENRARLIRNLHCWEAAIEVAQRRRKDHQDEKETKNSVLFMLYLTDLPGAKIEIEQRVGSSAGGGSN